MLRVHCWVVAAAVIVLAACAPLGGGGATKDTSTRPDAPAELARVVVPAGDSPPHWSYGGEDGPDAWGEMAEDWATCAEGTEQSPLDLVAGAPFEAQPTTTTTAEDATSTRKPARTTTAGAGDAAGGDAAAWPGAPAEQEIDFQYHASAYQVVDNGHTVQVNMDDAGSMIIDGVPFTLVQFHFHTPSEHLLGGAAYPMEYHLVHRNDADELAVVGVLVQWGAQNETLQPIFADLPGAGESVERDGTLNPAELLPANRTMVRYNGSLTTPPCSERVRWHVMLTPVQLSKPQVSAFSSVHPGSSRPTQDGNGRSVVVEFDTGREVVGASHG